MNAILALLQESDTLVIASPVYYLGFPGSLKMLIDRTYAESAIGRKITASILLTTACNKEEHVTNVMIVFVNAKVDHLC